MRCVGAVVRGVGGGVRLRGCGADDEGRVGLLFAALLGIVLAVVLVFANVAAVHLQHRRGLACADALALAGAAAVEGDVYFCPECDSGRADISVAGADGAVHSALVKFAGSTCQVGTSVQVEDVQVDGTEVRVVVGVASELPFLPPVLGDLAAPYIVVSGSAVVSDRP